MMRARKEEWSRLPTEMWSEIGKQLESQLDVLRFRSVCRTWRSALGPPMRLPMRVPMPPVGKNVSLVRSYWITQLSYYAVNETVVVFEEVKQGGNFSCSAIISSTTPDQQKEETIMNLKPSLSSSSTLDLSTLNFLSQAYHIHSSRMDPETGKLKCWPHFRVLKIVIISDSNSTVNPNYARDSDLTVVAHTLHRRKLAVLRLCSTDWETDFCSIIFDDIINYKGCLYGVDKYGSAFVMDYASLKMTKVAASLPDSCLPLVPYKRLHLTTLFGDFYLFTHSVFDTRVPSKLYKLCLRSQKWLLLQDDAFPHHVFFVDTHSNFPVPRALLSPNYDLPRFFSYPRFICQSLEQDPHLNRLPGFPGFRRCDVPWLPFSNLESIP